MYCNSSFVYGSIDVTRSRFDVKKDLDLQSSDMLSTITIWQILSRLLPAWSA